MKASLEAANIPIDYEEIEGDAHAYHLKKTEFAETLSFFDRNLLDPGESSVPLASGIYRIEGDGDGRTTVIDGSASERDPTWSPDGTAAVFASDVSGDQEIYSVALAGGDPFNFSLSPTSIDRQPAWSPDGSQVAFISDRLGSFDVFVAKANGSGATPLVKEGEGLANPSWSPDGQYIAFERRTEAGIDIFVIRVDGTGLVRLTDAAGHDRHPVWSPDGTRIAFSSERSGNGDIYTMAPDGTGVMLISGGVSPELYPSWQPIPSPLPDPGLTVGDVSVIEGNQGTVAAVFSLRLSRAVAWQAEAEYRTRKRFAIPGVDYTSVTGTVLFPPGETEGLVTVPVVGDLAVEANETFFLELSNPWGAVIDDGRGEGWIMDDDGPCVIRGTPGNDRLEGSSGPDYLCGFGGNDEIIGADGDDIISGGTGNDTLLVGAGADDVAGGEGGDRLSGEADDDTLTGGAGADVLQGGTEDDHLDTVDRIGGNDSADGGDGTDTARADPGDIVTNCP